MKTAITDEEGRYVVSLPWIEGYPTLPNNYDTAKKRLDNLMKCLDRDGYYTEYNKVIEEWELKGIIEEVKSDTFENFGFYLPHRHVVKVSSLRTKLRPVFDASAGYPSLNQCLHKGINLISLIPSLLIKFRLNKIGVTSDIEKAFLQISLNESDRDILRFL